jgi:glycine/D-amino acid oxidase-like deaminating enzyme
MQDARYLIIGAGVAGLATASQLAAAGARSVRVIERERQPGCHASLQNAGLIRQLSADPLLVQLALEGAAYLAANAPAVAFRCCGSLLAANAADWPTLQQQAQAARQLGLACTPLDAHELHQRAPLLAGGPQQGAIWTASDGVVEPRAIIEHYLAVATQAGAELICGAAARELTAVADTWRITLDTGRVLEGDILVDASGAWAGALATQAGAMPLGFEPRRRHLFRTGPLALHDPAGPWVWDVAGVYYRAFDDGGLLLSPCDVDPVAPGMPAFDPTRIDALRQQLVQRMPGLAQVPIHGGWAGLRTFAADGQLVVGWDPLASRYFWVAGLDGHGVTTSPAIGRLAARLLLSGPGTSDPHFASIAPRRFAQHPPTSH